MRFIAQYLQSGKPGDRDGVGFTAFALPLAGSERSQWRDGSQILSRVAFALPDAAMAAYRLGNSEYAVELADQTLRLVQSYSGNWKSEMRCIFLHGLLCMLGAPLALADSVVRTLRASRVALMTAAITAN